MADVLITEKNNFWNVKLNRPDKRNAFNQGMIKELTQFFKATVKKSKTARGVYLTGAGSSFCSGADLEWMRSMARYNLKENKEDAKILFELFEAASECPLPILGRIQGNVFGGGVGLVAICDIAVAEVGAKFCFSETRLGLIPAVISSFVLKKMKYNKAAEYMMTAKVFNAAEAYDSGLVEYVGRELEIEDYLKKTQEAILQCGPESVGEVKALLNHHLTAEQKQVKAYSIDAISRRRMSLEGQEGMSSFLEKRSANWFGSKSDEEE